MKINKVEMEKLLRIFNKWQTFTWILCVPLHFLGLFMFSYLWMQFFYIFFNSVFVVDNLGSYIFKNKLAPKQGRCGLKILLPCKVFVGTFLSVVSFLCALKMHGKCVLGSRMNRNRELYKITGIYTFFKRIV